jgi:glycerol-3-phosphate acyltransferase PlsY
MIALALFVSYLLGAIPFGVFVGRARGIDIRAVGSGNIGTTNVWRALGPSAGSLVFALDVAKGLAAPLLARVLAGNEYSIVALCALVAVLGHTFSVFLKFKGGKGIATAFGVLLGLNWTLALGLFTLWAVVLGLSRMISVASVVACVAAPVAFIAARQPWPYTAVIALFATVAIIKHIPNMKRIAAGTEPRLGSKKTGAAAANSTASNGVVSGP